MEVACCGCFQPGQLKRKKDKFKPESRGSRRKQTYEQTSAYTSSALGTRSNADRRYSFNIIAIIIP